MMRTTIACISLFLLVGPVGIGCEGSVTNNGGSGGTAGSGGSGASGATGGMGGGASGGGTTGGGGQSADCPEAEPTNGASCDVAMGVTCKFGDTCCPNVWGCFQGKWEEFDVDCGAPAPCPATPPASGDACGNMCSQWSPCGYACEAENALFALCENGTWQVTQEPCSDMIQCGDTVCAASDVCLETGGGAGVFYSCQPNPCANKPLSCECASSLCGGSTDVCQVSSGNHVACYCPDCP